MLASAQSRSTGKERDSETGLDYFGARYYGSNIGRFMSPDPLRWLAWQQSDGPSISTVVDMPSARDGLIGNKEDFRERIENPQLLNLYSYVGNNPLKFTDLFGLVEGSKENLKKRKAMDENARKQDGSIQWAYDKKKDNMPANSWKCSQFVNDTAKESGAEAKFDGRGPLAGEWRNPKAEIKDWRPLKPGETPQPGDVAAIKIGNPGVGATGHAGVVVLDGQGATTVMSAHQNNVSTAGAQNFNSQNSVTYRRYTGD